MFPPGSPWSAKRAGSRHSGKRLGGSVYIDSDFGSGFSVRESAMDQCELLRSLKHTHAHTHTLSPACIQALSLT